MLWRTRRRLQELEKIAVQAQTAAASSAASADQQRTRAEQRELALRQQADTDNRAVRQAFDEALERAGVVLFQQSAGDEDCFFVSSSIRPILGWSPSAFLRSGSFRSIVHTDDLRVFDRALRSAARSLADAESNPETDGVDTDHTGTDHTGIDHTGTDRVIDLTDTATIPSVSTRAMPTAGPAMPHHYLSEMLHDTSPVGGRPEFVVRFRSADGSWVRLAVRLDVSSPGNEPTVVAGALISVEQTHAEITVSDWFTQLVEHDVDGYLILGFLDSNDPDSLIIRTTNIAARKIFNLDMLRERDLHLEDVLVGSSAQLVRSAVFDVYHTGEAITADRLSFPELPGTYLDMRVMRLDDGTIGVIVKDVSSVVSIESRLRKQASHDALTGLPSRALLEERLDPVADASSPSAPVAVILVDTVDLSAINEDYGLNHGDDLLKQVGDRLVRQVRGVSVVARFGDGEFALVATNCCSHAEAVAVAHRVQSELEHPFDIKGHLVEVNFSVGMAVSPDHGQDARTLLRNASAALRDAKDSTDQFVVFHRTGDSESIRRLAMLSELRESLANNQLELRFQPQLDLRSGRVRKVEAVPRWIDDHQPSTMSIGLLELAEQSALIQPLTRWLLTEATRASRALRQTQPNPFGGDNSIVVSLNLSSRNLFDPDLETFIELLARSGDLEPGQIELEISEPGLMDDPAASQEVLDRLSGLGVNFVMDEFGTGYTSLATMRHLAVRGLKIDRSYLASIASVPSDAAVIRSTIELSHELGLFAAATGVTDLDVLALLVDFGCDFAQGPFLSEPVTLAALPGRIAEIEEVARAWLGADLRR